MEKVLFGLLFIISLSMPGARINVYQHQYTDKEIKMIAATIQLENPSTGDTVEDQMLARLLTGQVVVNRVESDNWPDTVYDVLYQGYKTSFPQQYATHTIVNLDTVRISDDCMAAAKVVTKIRIAPADVIYQSQNPKNGSKIYKKIGKECFAYE